MPHFDNEARTADSPFDVARSAACRLRGSSQTVTMFAMFFARTRPQQIAPWTRVWVSALLLLGVLSMHSAIISDEGGLVDHHGAVSLVQNSASSVAAAAGLVAEVVDVPELAPPRTGESGVTLSDCGGIAMLCLAMLVGASAYIVLRRRVLDRILWQDSLIFVTTFGRPNGPFEARSPRERSSVLRR